MDGQCYEICAPGVAGGCGEGLICSPGVRGGRGDEGVCPLDDRATGQVCEWGYECKSFLCVIFEIDGPGLCTARCNGDDDCAGGGPCNAAADLGPDVPVPGWAGYCEPAQGSPPAMGCDRQAPDCPAGRVCAAVQDQPGVMDGQCYEPCDPADVGACGADVVCGGVVGGGDEDGVCPLDLRRDGAQCEWGYECASFLCIIFDEFVGGICTPRCNEDVDCDPPDMCMDAALLGPDVPVPGWGGYCEPPMG